MSQPVTRTLVSRPARNVHRLPFSTAAPTTVSAAVRPLPAQHLQHQHRQHSEKSLSKYCANSSRLTSFYLSPDWIHVQPRPLSAHDSHLFGHSNVPAPSCSGGEVCAACLQHNTCNPYCTPALTWSQQSLLIIPPTKI